MSPPNLTDTLPRLPTTCLSDSTGRVRTNLQDCPNGSKVVTAKSARAIGGGQVNETPTVRLRGINSAARLADTQLRNLWHDVQTAACWVRRIRPWFGHIVERPRAARTPVTVRTFPLCDAVGCVDHAEDRSASTSQDHMRRYRRLRICGQRTCNGGSTTG